ncbi:MAG TPA: hypothetical protein VI873_01030 [Candidatus Peribacteraceae bacterium]|nr:hypothetical protein [Candidatus Peribacteraceae bacterium]
MKNNNAPQENPKENLPEKGATVPKTLKDLQAEVVPARAQEMLAARKEVITRTDDNLVALARRIEKENPPERRYESILMDR